MTTGRLAVTVLGAALCVAAASTGWAQYPGGGTSGGRAGRGGAQGPGAGGREGSPMAAVVAPSDLARGQLDDFADDLKLDPAQRPLWSAYATKVQQLADDVARNRNALRFPKGPAPEQLEFVAETLRNRLTAVEDINDAGKALYAVLTPAQKSIADDRLARISIPLIAPSQGISVAAPRGLPAGDAPNPGKSH
jgi:hypothetical protein